VEFPAVANRLVPQSPPHGLHSSKASSGPSFLQPRPDVRRVRDPLSCASQLPQPQLRSELRRMVSSRTTIGRAFPNSTTLSPNLGPLITTPWTVPTVSASLGSRVTRR
jgi:hypothetical protein